MRAAHRQWASWFWILFVGNDDRGSHLDAAPEKDQEYQAVRIIGKDSLKSGSCPAFFIMVISHQGFLAIYYASIFTYAHNMRYDNSHA